MYIQNYHLNCWRLIKTTTISQSENYFDSILFYFQCVHMSATKNIWLQAIIAFSHKGPSKNLAWTFVKLIDWTFPPHQVKGNPNFADFLYIFSEITRHKRHSMFCVFDSDTFFSVRVFFFIFELWCLPHFYARNQIDTNSEGGRAREKIFLVRFQYAFCVMFWKRFLIDNFFKVPLKNIKTTGT